jgi:hypothetical protein
LVTTPISNTTPDQADDVQRVASRQQRDDDTDQTERSETRIASGSTNESNGVTRKPLIRGSRRSLPAKWQAAAA